jgi:hypothetical protein
MKDNEVWSLGPDVEVERQTFVERLPAMAEPFAHQTCRVRELVRLIAQPTHRNARQAIFDRVRQLRAAGKTMRAIAAETGVGWRTVTKWVRSGCLPDRTPMTPRPSSPGYFKN